MPTRYKPVIDARKYVEISEEEFQAALGDYPERRAKAGDLSIDYAFIGRPWLQEVANASAA